MANYNNRLPGLNYTADLTNDDWRMLESLYETELLQRLRLMFDSTISDSAGLNRYGIVSSTDPRVPTNNVLMPSADTNDPFLYNISPGVAVSPLGQIAVMTATDLSVVISDPTNDGLVAVGRNYIIVLNYIVKDSDPRLNDEGDFLSAQRILVANQDMLNVVPEPVFNSLTDIERQSMVVLGIVTVGQDEFYLKNTTLLVDNSVYKYNRPWFSPVDVEHRNMIGAGDSTFNNPHGTTLEDLDTGAVPLFEQLVSDGMIIAKDFQANRTPGTKIKIPILFKAISANRYVQLSRVPVCLGPLLDQSGLEYPYEYLPDLNQIRLGVVPPDNGSGTIYDMQLNLTVVDALEPSLNSGGGSLHFTAPTAWETIISEGHVVRNMMDQDVAVSDLGPLPCKFEVYCTGLGKMLRSPATLMCQSRIGSTVQVDNPIPVSLAPARPFLVRPILFDANNEVRCKVTVIGWDTSNTKKTVVIEDVHYDPARTAPSPDAVTGYMLFPAVRGLPPEFGRIKQLIADQLELAEVNICNDVVWSRLESITISEYSDSSFTSQTTLTLLAYLDPRSLPVATYASFSPLSGVASTFTSRPRNIRHSVVEHTYGKGVLGAAMDSLIAKYRIDNPGTSPYNPLFLIEDFTRPQYMNFVDSSLAPANGSKGIYISRAIDLRDTIWKDDTSPDSQLKVYLSIPGASMSTKARITIGKWDSALKVWMPSIVSPVYELFAEGESFGYSQPIIFAPELDAFNMMYLKVEIVGSLDRPDRFGGTQIPGFVAIVAGDPA